MESVGSFHGFESTLDVLQNCTDRGKSCCGFLQCLQLTPKTQRSSDWSLLLFLTALSRRSRRESLKFVFGSAFDGDAPLGDPWPLFWRSTRSSKLKNEGDFSFPLSAVPFWNWMSHSPSFSFRFRICCWRWTTGYSASGWSGTSIFHRARTLSYTFVA